jgi:hypothetical protein
MKRSGFVDELQDAGGGQPPYFQRCLGVDDLCRIWATANLLAPVTAPEDSAALECASSFIDATKSIKQPP